MSEIRLWSIQHARAWERAEQAGVLKADGRRVDPDFRPAYRWLMSQMTQKISNYHGEYPIWAWAEPKPDLRSSAHLAKGEPGVRLRLDVPRANVLLSGFDAWHAVLGGWHCNLDEAEHIDYWNRVDRAGDDPEAIAELQAYTETSWQRIFDIDLLRAHQEWGGPIDYVQATLGNVALEQVTRVEYFTAR